MEEVVQSTHQARVPCDNPKANSNSNLEQDKHSKPTQSIPTIVVFWEINVQKHRPSREEANLTGWAWEKVCTRGEQEEYDNTTHRIDSEENG